MSVAVITGAAGLVGSEAARHFAGLGMDVFGVDNDMRAYFFGEEASTQWNQARVQRELGPRYHPVNADIRDRGAIERLFRDCGGGIVLVVNAAAQPSHEWAQREPDTDFTVNAYGTLILLEMTRRYCPEAVFIHVSTNKVYGDHPNRLPLVEQPTRWEVDPSHPYSRHGVDESMPIDQSTHSLFGVSKAAADLLVQEYGRCFGMKTVCFRSGCVSGPGQAGVEQHGFLAYLMKCAVTGRRYTVFGHKGKQVRDPLHSRDLVRAFGEFFQRPRSGEVYNIGGGRKSHCSVLEAIRLCEELAGRQLDWSYCPTARAGDHIWWISDARKFASHYPAWSTQYDVRSILQEVLEEGRIRWGKP